MISAPGGVVASGHPAAAAVGSRTLAAGGSATDAALAMAFTQWVVNAPLCGPGGDLFALRVVGNQPVVFGGWSRVPLDLDGGDLPYAGPGAAVVPGALPAAHAVWKAGGRLDWESLFGGALEACRGHEVTEWMAKSFASVEKRGHGPAIGQVFDTSTIPRAGERISSRRLESSLGIIAAHGPGALLPDGPLGEALLAAARQSGVALSARDLERNSRPDERPAETAEVDGMRISFPGSPSQAGITAQLLAGVEREVPVESSAFAQAVAAPTERALVQRCVVGRPGTAASVAAQGDEAVVIVHSLAGVQFGTGWIAGETGVALGNRVGTALTRRPDLPAAHPRPGEYPPHTLSAAWLETEDRSMLVATPGGDRQVQWLAQAAQRFRQGRALDEVVQGPRWFVCPEGDRFGVPQGVGAPWMIWAERGIDWRDQLECAGYPVRPVDSVGGGLQAVARTGEQDWTAESDDRAGGTAAAP